MMLLNYEFGNACELMELNKLWYNAGVKETINFHDAFEL